MNATIKLENVKHFPVLLNEVISIISPLYGGTFIDCTFGEGGYSKKILENKSNKILAIDRDKNNFKIINQFKKKYQGRFDFENKKFSEILNTEKKINNLKGIIFDLGYSTTQIKDPKKGLSFNSKGKLNMRMGFNSISASDVINKLEQKELSRIFKIFDSKSDCSGFSSFKTWRAYLTALWGDFNLILFNESNSADLDITLPCALTLPIKRMK